MYGVTYLLTLLPFSTKVCLYSELEFFLLLEEVEGGGGARGSMITGSLLAMAMLAASVVVLGFLEFETKGEGTKGSY